MHKSNGRIILYWIFENLDVNASGLDLSITTGSYEHDHEGYISGVHNCGNLVQQLST
jgi:hypothetical protein